MWGFGRGAVAPPRVGLKSILLAVSVGAGTVGAVVEGKGKAAAPSLGVGEAIVLLGVICRIEVPSGDAVASLVSLGSDILGFQEECI